MNFRARVFLETLRAPGTVLLNCKATTLSYRVLHDLGVLSEALAVSSVPQLAHVLGHLVTPRQGPGHGVAQTHGCCSSMAAMVEGASTEFHYLKKVYKFYSYNLI